MIDGAVALPVALDLGEPVLRIPAGLKLGLSFAPEPSVPEVPVAKNRHAVVDENQIRTARKMLDIGAVAESQHSECLSQQHFRNGILTLIARSYSTRRLTPRPEARVSGHRQLRSLGWHDVGNGIVRLDGKIIIMPRVISLFSGAGGLDYGLEAAGFEFGAGVEMDADCAASLARSRPDWQVVNRSIFSVSSRELLALAAAKKGEIDLVAGGPPCQPFSKAGYWASGDARRLSDPRADTLGAYLRVVRETLPQVVLLENVEGLKYAGKDEGLQLLLRELNDINREEGTSYVPFVKVLNAADYGVPQLRERVFVVAHRDGLPFRFPSPTHTSTDAKGKSETDLEPHRTAWDALGDLTNADDEDLAVRGKWADLLPSIPEGCNYLHHTDRGGGMPLFGWRRRYWTFLLKLAKNRPSWTIQAQPGPAVGPFHWSNRRLSIRELSRLQTFPEDVTIVGQRGSAQKQLGNAVPSLLAEVIGRAIRAQLLGQRITGKPKLLPRRCNSVPPPERVRAVPRKFHSLAGKHTPHPGTGRGHAASRRHLMSA